MLDTPISISLSDFSQRYNHCFGWLIQDQRKVLVKITKVEANKVFFETSSDKNYYALADKGVVFEFLPVIKGYIPAKKGIYLLSRYAARQFNRGISAHNTQILKLSQTRMDMLDCSIEVISDIYGSDVSYQDTVEEYLKKKSKVCALSRHFAIQGIRVLFFDKVIGTVTDQNTLTVIPYIHQELSDLVKRESLEFKITCPLS